MLYTLITGASGGIGAQLARYAAADGRALVLVARSQDKLEALAQSLDTEVVVIVSDLSRPHAARDLVAQLHEKNIEVSELINNAGVGDYGLFDSSELQTQLDMIQLNVTSLVELTHLLLPSIKAHRGKIMNVGSVASFLPGPLMSTYFSTKHFVLSFSESLHEELRHSGVSITCLCPGPTATGFGSRAHVGKGHSISNTNTTADSVAKIGWRAMQRGDAIVINSFYLRVGVFIANRLLPRFLVRRIVMRYQK